MKNCGQLAGYLLWVLLVIVQDGPALAGPLLYLLWCCMENIERACIWHARTCLTLPLLLTMHVDAFFGCSNGHVGQSAHKPEHD